MAEQEVAEDEVEEGTVLVMLEVVANDDGTWSVMLGGCAAIPSNDSVQKR